LASPGAEAEASRLQHRRPRVGAELERGQEERVVELLLGQRGVLARAEGRDPSAHLVDEEVAHLVDRLRLAARGRAALGIADEGIGHVHPAPAAAQEHRPRRLAHLEHRMLAAQREGGLLVHRLRQRPIDAQRPQPLRQRPGRRGLHRAVAAHVRRPGGEQPSEGEQEGEEGAH